MEGCIFAFRLTGLDLEILTSIPLSDVSCAFPAVRCGEWDVVPFLQFKSKVVQNDVGVESLHKRLHVIEEAHVGWLNLAGGTRRDSPNTEVSPRDTVAWIATWFEKPAHESRITVQ
ncbi:unnamed protein product [Heligmosomoides polygyrus]|uniref:Uncharacterized protein n=1 Tax=Heligmosomoides polygyrus TaxID=6339 RepID=A0A183FC27_HELPZ|nr:unnamed protein product [Heligmosomoides polygyrus]